MDREKRPKKKWIRNVGAAVAILIMLPGVYYAGIRYIGSKKISAALLGAAVLAIALVIIVGLLLKKEKRQRFLKIVTLVLVFGLGLVNLGTLISPYFIAHNTTTIQNRYYPNSLSYMALLQRVTAGKTVWVDESNDYLDGDSEKNTATDFSNRAAVHYACEAIKTLSPSPGELTQAHETWLQSKEDKYLKFVTLYDIGLVKDREETAYVYKGMGGDDYTDIVFLWGESGDAYWIPMAVYDEMMGETDGQE